MFAGKIKSTDTSSDKAKSFANIIKSYELRKGALVEGYLGVNPNAIGPVISAYGIDIKSYLGPKGQIEFESVCKNLGSKQMAILCYWFIGSNGPRGHYIAITKTGTTYNLINDDAGTTTSIKDFLRSNASRGFIQGWIINI